jgi:hypothetical protein
MSDLKEDKLKAVNLKNLTLKELTLKELTLKGLTLKKPILKKLILKRLFLMVIVQWDYQSCIKVINFYQEVAILKSSHSFAVSLLESSLAG